MAAAFMAVAVGASVAVEAGRWAAVVEATVAAVATSAAVISVAAVISAAVISAVAIWAGAA